MLDFYFHFRVEIFRNLSFLYYTNINDLLHTCISIKPKGTNDCHSNKGDQWDGTSSVEATADFPEGIPCYRGTTASIQTSWRDYQCLFLSSLSDTKEELQVCLAWMCNCMDQIGRAREIAYKKLVELERVSYCVRGMPGDC